jgi:hypothetical protein
LSYRYELTASVLKMRFSIVVVILFTASVTAQGGIVSSIFGQLTSAAGTASARPTSAIASLAAGLPSIAAGTDIASISSVAAVTSSSTRPTLSATSPWLEHRSKSRHRRRRRPWIRYPLASAPAQAKPPATHSTPGLP